MIAFAISEDLAFQMTLIKEYVRLYAYKIILSLSNNLYLQQCLTFVRTFFHGYCVVLGGYIHVRLKKK